MAPPDLLRPSRAKDETNVSVAPESDSIDPRMLLEATALELEQTMVTWSPLTALELPVNLRMFFVDDHKTLITTK